MIKSKADFHEGMDRIGFMVPPIKSSGCTVDYLQRVRSGEYWCGKYEEGKLRSCYRPPKKDVIFKEIEDILAQRNMQLGFSDASKVPLDWLIIQLSTLNPDHRFFHRTYYPDEHKPNHLPQSDRVNVDNSDGMFDLGIPPRGKQSRSSIQFVKNDAVEQELSVLSCQMNNYMENMALLQAKMDNLLSHSQMQSQFGHSVR